MIAAIRNLNRNIANTSVITKITLLYIIAIFIPSISMTVFSYRQARLRAEENAISVHSRIFDEVYNDLVRAVNGAEMIGEQLSFNADLRNFLSRPYEDNSESVLEYTRQISPIAVYAQRFQGGDIDGIKVFYVNDTIPEHWVYFYAEDRLLASNWYTEFRRSADNSVWVYPNESGVNSEYLDIESHSVVSYARKIFDPQREYIGSIVVDLSDNRILANFNKLSTTSECFGIYDSNGTSIISTCASAEGSANPIASLIGNATPAQSSHRIRLKNLMYFFRSIPIHDYTLVHKIDVGFEIRRAVLYQFSTVFVIIGAILILEAITFFGLRGFFRRLRLITSAMNSAAEGNFQIRIPVPREDEIGQITEDFNKMIMKIQSLVEENVRRETAQKSAQLTALQFQLNPHFLYNMIDTFRMKLVIEDTHDIADSLAHFGKMLRYNISAKDQYATLGEEITYVKQYHSIQQLRYEGGVTLETSIPESDYGITILRFILQPVVENAIKHGMGVEQSRLQIEISGRRIDDVYELSIRDDGEGIGSSQLLKLNDTLSQRREVNEQNLQTSEGIGLANISERLNLFYGDKARIYLESEKAKYTRTIMIIPVGHGA